MSTAINGAATEAAISESAANHPHAARDLSRK